MGIEVKAPEADAATAEYLRRLYRNAEDLMLLGAIDPTVGREAGNLALAILDLWAAEVEKAMGGDVR